MREIEIKAKIKDFDSVLNRLKEIGCSKVSQSIRQKDRIFLKEGIGFLNIKRGTNILRIREEGAKTIFTLKQSQENELDCIEKEVIIDDAQKMEEILRHLGYHEVVRINKKRRMCSFRKYNICLDEVVGLGRFIEIEKISKKEEDGARVQAELLQFLLDLGIKKEETVMRGYDTLMFNKTNRAV